MTVDTLEHLLDRARIDASVHDLRPDYRALLIAVDGLKSDAAAGASDDRPTETLLREAESAARDAVAVMAVEELPHVAAWRDAYRAFGAKPQRTRHSLEALLRRGASEGLPRVNALTDLYNAISVLHQLPIGGEDLARYVGSPVLVRADGSEPFDTVAGGEPVIEHPAPGEVVWRDDAGVTCRRWNWRQCHRTALGPHTTRALFILDALAPMSDADLSAAGQDLAHRLIRLGSSVVVASRLLSPPSGG